MTYELFYWKGLPGRGEFVRLAFEATGTAFEQSDKLSQLDTEDWRPFAPPILRHEGKLIGQTSAILRYLGPRLGLAGAGEADALWVDQMQMTIMDCTAEAHNVHHPLSPLLYYGDQRGEAARAAKCFRNERLEKFLGWFAAALRRKEGPFLLGGALSYADLSLFQLLSGLRYGFPKAMERHLEKWPELAQHCKQVTQLPAMADYLRSERRPPFNEEGIFRRYWELDDL